MEQLPPAATCLPQVFATTAKSPSMKTSEMIRVAVPVLVRVTFSSEVWPISVLGKVSLAGESTAVAPLGGPQLGKMRFAMRVFQLNLPFDSMYSCVYQKVQSSTGSTDMAL